MIPPRVRLALMAGATIALATALAIVLLTSPGEQAPAGRFAGSLRPDIPPQDFRLRDENGRKVSLSDNRGRPVILTFLYSTCRDTCPLTAQQIRGALDKLGSQSVPALAVSVDPANDTRANVERFLVRQHVLGRLRFLTGSSRQLAPIWKAYGIRPQGTAFDHSAYVLLIDSKGRQRVSFPVAQLTPEDLAHDVRALIDET